MPYRMVTFFLFGTLMASACASSSSEPAGKGTGGEGGLRGPAGGGSGAPGPGGSAGSQGAGGTASAGSQGSTSSGSGGSKLGEHGDATATAGAGDAAGGAGAGAPGAPDSGGTSDPAGQDSGAGAASGVRDGGAEAGMADKSVAAVLDRYALLKPCSPGFKLTPNPNGDCCCEETAAEENQHKTLHFGGEPGVTYDVTLHVRGVAERYWYEGGMLDGTLFYRGGLPTIHSAATATKNANLKPGKGACKVHPPETDSDFALPFKVPADINPSDGCFNGFNIFALVVSEPKKSYYLNYTTDFDNVDRQPHKVYKNDYVVTIPIQGGAALDFYTIDGDHHQVTNDGTMSIDGVRLAQPYNGNFLEFEVVNVKRPGN